MSALYLQAEFADLLRRRGLREFGDFFRVPAGEAVSRHPSRSCVRLDLGSDQAFLKREHFIPFKDYFESWWAGFGFVSKSRREWQALVMLRQRGIGCPEPLAAGECQGRAFLLVRDLPGALDLRAHLLRTPLWPADRARLAHHVGKAISDLHAAGFTHPDLYAKHVFVQGDSQAIAFIDLQRTCRRRRVSWRRRSRDLAALHASLGDDLVSPRERSRCLVAYVRQTLAADRHGPVRPRERRRLLRRAVRAIERRTRRLMRRRKIRWMREPTPAPPGAMVMEYWRLALEDRGAPATPASAPSFHRRGGPPA
jgi:tRNA A-37 threonylcarbamoyl transferase component Bud32